MGCYSHCSPLELQLAQQRIAAVDPQRGRQPQPVQPGEEGHSLHLSPGVFPEKSVPDGAGNELKIKGHSFALNFSLSTCCQVMQGTHMMDKPSSPSRHACLASPPACIPPAWACMQVCLPDLNTLPSRACFADVCACKRRANGTYWIQHSNEAKGQKSEPKRQPPGRSRPHPGCGQPSIAPG